MKCDKCNNQAKITSQVSKYKLCDSCYEESVKQLINQLNKEGVKSDD